MPMDAELEREFGHVNSRLDDLKESVRGIEAQLKSALASIQSNTQMTERRLTAVEAHVEEHKRAQLDARVGTLEKIHEQGKGAVLAWRIVLAAGSAGAALFEFWAHYGRR